jgi:hypothetical protein
LSETILSLDVETSGANPYLNCVLSLAAKEFYSGAEFYADIRYELEEPGKFKSDTGQVYEIEPAAMEVNGLSIPEIADSRRLELSAVNVSFQEFLLNKVFREQPIAPMGLNVGSFDVAFIKRHLPLGGTMLSYRDINLNSLFYFTAVSERKSFMDVRDPILRWADERGKEVLPQLGAHHALFDVYTNCFSFMYLTKVIPNWVEKLEVAK